MSSIQMCSRRVKLIFSVNVNDFDEFNTQKSSEDDLSWKIRLRKISASGRRVSQRGQNNNRNLAINVYLICKYKESENTNWCIEAGATLKLLTHGEHKKTIEKTIEMMTFSKDQLTSSLENFILWSDLIDENNFYVKEGIVTFEAVIVSNPMHLANVPNSEVSSVEFGMVLQDVKNLNYMDSSKITVRGIEWIVRLFKKDNRLGIFLLKKTKTDIFWIFQVNFGVKLSSHNSKGKPVEMKLTHTFHSNSSSCGWINFISYDNLSEKSCYVENSAAFFEMSIEVGEQDPFWKIDKSLPSTIAYQCPICFESLSTKKVRVTRCGHLFCSLCIKRSIRRHRKCPLCNSAAVPIDLRTVYLQ